MSLVGTVGQSMLESKPRSPSGFVLATTLVVFLLLLGSLCTNFVTKKGVKPLLRILSQVPKLGHNPGGAGGWLTRLMVNLKRHGAPLDGRYHFVFRRI